MDGSIIKIKKMKSISQNLKLKYIYTLVFLLYSATVLFAQDPPGFTDNVIDNTAAPIDNYVIPMLVIALIIGSVLLKKKSINCLK